LGLFYAGNILGGVFGTLFAGFYLLRVHDAWFATYVAVVINVVVAGMAWVLAAWLTPERPQTNHDPPLPGRGPLLASKVVYMTIALSGFCALAAEVIWTRLLSLLFGGTVYAFSIILAVFLIGLGIGSTVGSFASRAARPPVLFAWSQLLVVG